MFDSDHDLSKLSARGVKLPWHTHIYHEYDGYERVVHSSDGGGILDVEILGEEGYYWMSFFDKMVKMHCLYIGRKPPVYSAIAEDGDGVDVGDILQVTLSGRDGKVFHPASYLRRNQLQRVEVHSQNASSVSFKIKSWMFLISLWMKPAKKFYKLELEFTNRWTANDRD